MLTVAETTSLGVTAAVALFSPWSSAVEPAPREGPIVQNVVRYADWEMPAVTQTSTSGLNVKQSAAIAVPDGAAMAQQLKEESGLTAEQLGRMLGVTRRSVHNWAAGASIAPKHRARLQKLHELVFGLAATTPDERRDLLLDSATRPSLYRQLVNGTSRAARVQYPVPMIERFA